MGPGHDGHGHAHGAGAHHGHGHHHGAEAGQLDRRRLAVVAVVMAVVATLEVVAGLAADSLALLSDAVHAFGDLFSIVLSLVAVHVSLTWPPDDRRTFGYHRGETLAGLVNALVLIGASAFIVWDAWRRFQDPPAVRGGLVTLAAVAVLTFELIAGVWLLKGRSTGSVNVRSVVLHLVSDAIGTALVLVTGLVLLWRPDLAILDPLLAAGISVVLVAWAVRIARDALHELFAGVPAHLDVDRIREDLLGLEGVEDVHDLHVWNLSPREASLTAHVVTCERPVQACLDRCLEMLREAHGLDHVTLQLEYDEACGRGH